MIEMSDGELLRIAEKIIELRPLAAQLNMISDLQRIKADNPNNTLDQGHCFLTKWYKKGGKRHELVQALDKVGNKILANQ